MAEELTRALERRAERGSPRGATAVLAEAALQVTADSERLPTWRRGPAIAVATAGVMLLVVGGVLLGSRLLGTDAVAPAETSAPAPPAVDFEELVWSRLPLDETIFVDAALHSVTAFNGNLVAAGEDVRGAAVWTSPDGVEWTRVSFATTPSAPGHVREVVPGGPGLVAIVDGGEADMVWTSPDGIEWTPVDYPFNGQLEAITQGGPGLVMVGDGLVYISIDGREWALAQCPDCSATGEFDYLVDVVAGGPGLIAVGNFTDAGTGPAFAWTSPDGVTWSRIPLHEEVELESITAGGPGFVAVGHSSEGAGVLTSSDGTNWSRVPHDEEVFGRSLMDDVVAVGDGLVAIGGWSWGDGQAWTSPDGLNWTRVPYDESVFGSSSILDAVVFGDRLIAVGSASSDADAALWIAALTGTIETATSTATASAETLPPLVRINTVWDKAEIAALAEVEIADITSLPGGGFGVLAGSPLRDGGNVLWTRDGITWRDADPDALTLPSGWRAAYDERIISALPGRLVVLNRTMMSDPAVWLGDLATGAWEPFSLNTEGLFHVLPEQVAVASNDTRVLVVATALVGPDWQNSDTRYVSWVVDPATGQADRGTLPTEFGDPTMRMDLGSEHLEAEWSGQWWVLASGNTTAVSEDGLAWISTAGLGTEDRHVTSLTAGSDGLIATTGRGWDPHLAWYSEDGLEWVELLFFAGRLGGYAYSDEFGFVVVEDGRVLTSKDGRSWEWTFDPSLPQQVGEIAASGNSVLVLADSPVLLTLDVDD